MVITTWTAAAGWLRLISFVNAILIGWFALGKVASINMSLIAPLMGILLIIILGTLLVGRACGKAALRNCQAVKVSVFVFTDAPVPG